jgi:predicted metal-dependent hydrolase
MLKKACWVWQHITAFRSQHEEVLPRHYVSGETQFYLGRRYILRVLFDVNAGPSVKLLRGKLAVVLRHDDEKKTQIVKALVNQWYQYRAKIMFQERLNIMLPKTTWVAGRPLLRLLTMQKTMR